MQDSFTVNDSYRVQDSYRVNDSSAGYRILIFTILSGYRILIFTRDLQGR